MKKTSIVYRRPSENDAKKTMRLNSIKKLTVAETVQFYHKKNNNNNKKQTIAVNNFVCSNINQKVFGNSLKNNQAITRRMSTGNLLMRSNRCFIQKKQKQTTKGSRNTRNASKKQKHKKAISKPVDPNHQVLPQQFLLINSTKLKKIIWNQPLDDHNFIPVIISLDFIINQDQFWQNSSLATNNLGTQQLPTFIKNYKALHKAYYVIWIIRNYKSFIKLRKLSLTHELPIHALYYYKQKRNYTLDYTPVYKQIIKTFGNRANDIVILQPIKINTKDICRYEGYNGIVPIVFCHRESTFRSINIDSSEHDTKKKKSQRILTQKQKYDDNEFQQQTGLQYMNEVNISPSLNHLVQFKVCFIKIQQNPLDLSIAINLLKYMTPHNKTIIETRAFTQPICIKSRNTSNYTTNILSPKTSNNIDKKINKLSSIEHFVNQYYFNRKKLRQEQKSNNSKQIKLGTPLASIISGTSLNKNQFFIEQQQVQERVQKFRKQLIEYVIDTKGRNFQHQGSSAYYLVGDIIKRNYNNLINFASKQLKPKYKNKLSTIQENNEKVQNSPWKNQQKQTNINYQQNNLQWINLPINYYEYSIQ